MVVVAEDEDEEAKLDIVAEDDDDATVAEFLVVLFANCESFRGETERGNSF